MKQQPHASDGPDVPSHSPNPRSRWQVLTLGGYALLGGLTSFLGYVFDIRRLTDWDDDNISIQPNAALCVLFSGMSLMLAASNRRRLATLSAGLVLLIGGSTLLEWITGLSFGHDALFLFGREWGRTGVLSPGRMGPPGSFSWTLTGAALLLTALPPEWGRWRRWAPALALATAAISAVSLVGYLYGANLLFAIPTLTIIALQTSTFLMAASLGVIASHPDREPMRMLVDGGGAGILARRFVPLLVAVTVGLGFLCVGAQVSGLVDTGMGTALLVLFMLAILAVPLWLTLDAVRRRERAIAEQGERLRTTLASIGDAVIATDTEGRITNVNAAAESVTGWKQKEAVGRPLDHVFRIVREQAGQSVEGPMSRALRDGAVVGLANHTVLITKNGTELPIDDSSSPIKDAQGRVFGSVLIFRDISDRRQAEAALKERAAEVAAALGKRTEEVQRAEKAEQQLREADRRKDEFLATLAHELRNPLAPIRNSVQILKVKDPPDPDLKWCREVIDRQVQHMARLLDDLLDVSRITHNKLELRTERIELAAVIQSAVETSRPLIDAGGHELVVVLPPDPVYLDADPVRLAQILSNLLNNAAKYSEPGGRIELTCKRQGSDLLASVKDCGVGIAADMLPRIFDMFSQAKRVLERSRGGLGIGLSLVRGLVELHGGGIEARSEGPGKGSEFLVRLPIVVEKLAEETSFPSKEEEQSCSTKRRLLIVDDLKDSADSLAMLLKKMGHEVRTAYDGEEAVLAAEKFQPEVVLLDIGMPGLNGYDACRRIRQQPWGKRITLVALTGWGQQEDRRRTEEAGFDGHLVKPVNARDLVELLTQRQAMAE